MSEPLYYRIVEKSKRDCHYYYKIKYRKIIYKKDNKNFPFDEYKTGFVLKVERDEGILYINSIYTTVLFYIYNKNYIYYIYIIII